MVPATPDNFDIDLLQANVAQRLSAVDYWVSSFKVVAYENNAGRISVAGPNVQVTTDPLWKGDAEVFAPRSTFYNLKDFWVIGDYATDGGSVSHT